MPITFRIWFSLDRNHCFEVESESGKILTRGYGETSDTAARDSALRWIARNKEDRNP